MLRVLTVFLALCVAPQMANAQAFWIDYGWKVEPQNEKRFATTFAKFRATDTFKKFNGKIWFNVNVADGTDPATHSFATVYESLEDFERLSAELAVSEDWNKFRRGLAAAGELVNTASYMHVKGWGEHPKDKSAFIGQVIQVTNPVGYMGALTKMMGESYMDELPGALDVWQILAGGPPGATHLVVFGYDRFSEGSNFTNKMSSNPQFVGSMMGLGKFRTTLGTVWTSTPAKFGPSQLSGLR